MTEVIGLKERVREGRNLDIKKIIIEGDNLLSLLLKF